MGDNRSRDNESRLYLLPLPSNVPIGKTRRGNVIRFFEKSLHAQDNIIQ